MLSPASEAARLRAAPTCRADHVACICRHNAYFVDLFVRASNDMGVKLYERLGYTTYRRVLGYYSNVEDALGGPAAVCLPHCLVHQ